MVYISRGDRTIFNKVKNTEQDELKPRFPHCPNCGAPLKSTKCEYCGSEWIGLGLTAPKKKRINPLYGVPNHEDSMYIWLECNQSKEYSGIHLYVVAETNRGRCAYYRKSSNVPDGLEMNLSDISCITGRKTLDCLRLDINALRKSMKTYTLYVAIEPEQCSNLGMIDELKLCIKGFGSIESIYSLDEDFALDNCVNVFTITQDIIRLNAVACNFDVELKPII